VRNRPDRGKGSWFVVQHEGGAVKTTNAVVRDALAHHLDRDPSTLEAWQHLELDLDLSPSDMALVLREIGDIEDIELSTDTLTSLSTVGDLQVAVCRTVAREKREDSLDRIV
jgi:hypothetical protein